MAGIRLRNIIKSIETNYMFKCMGKIMQGKELTPRAIGKIRKGKYFIPDCQDYEPRIDLPKKVRISAVFTGWNCRNCKNLKAF